MIWDDSEVGVLLKEGTYRLHQESFRKDKEELDKNMKKQWVFRGAGL